jgi:DNA-directed RNA polymerase subunit beta
LKTYERIVKGQNLTKPGVPESFRVLVKELQGLALDVEIMYDDGTIGEVLLDDEDEEVAVQGASRPRPPVIDLESGDEVLPPSSGGVTEEMLFVDPKELDSAYEEEEPDEQDLADEGEDA